MTTWEAAFAAARHFERLGDWPAAFEGYRNLYHNGHGGESAVVFHYGLAHLHLGAPREAELLIERALAMDADNEEWKACLAGLRSGERAPAGGAASSPELQSSFVRASLHRAEAEISLPVGPASTNAAYVPEVSAIVAADSAAALPVDHSALAAEHKRTRQRWQEIQVLEAGLPLHGALASWHVRLGDAREAMNRFDEAADAYGAANRIDPSSARIHFMEGSCRLRAGDSVAASRLFATAVALDTELGAGAYGVGVFHQQRGDWTAAAGAYREELVRQPHHATLAYRTALALERCYEWESAADMYRQATAMDPAAFSWHYRRGFVFERLERWADAAEAYSYGMGASPKPAPYWAYRCGFVLERAERYEEACRAHLMARPDLNEAATLSSADIEPSAYAEAHIDDALEIALRNPSPQASFTVAEKAESLGMYRQASAAYQAAIDRSSEVRADWYYRLGWTLTLIKEFKSAASTFRMTRVFDDAHGVDTTGYRKDKGLLDVMYYTTWRENLPLREDVILYESFHGDSVSCNPLALFEEVCRREEFDRFLHVWVANDNAHVPPALRTHPNVAIIRRSSPAYRRHLATAKYLINNVTFPAYFAARPGQQYLNTWHGTPLKTLGKDIGTGFLEHKNVARNFLHATHVLAPNRFTADVLTHRYDVDTLMTGKVAVTGYPRVDRTLNATELARANALRLLGINAVDSRPVVLYAPTWRGGLSTTHFDMERLKSDLARLAALDCNVVFRAHHRTQELLAGMNLGVTIAADSIETNELLAVVDVLVTDYSSIVFDFLPTGKHVAMYTYDLDEYKSERGLYIDPSSMGLPTANTIDELVDIVSTQILSGGHSAGHAGLVDKYCPRDDGQASKRAVDFFFFDDDSDQLPQAPAKKSLLFHHSFIPNGITSSLLNLLNYIDPDEYDVTVVVPVDDTAAHPERVEKFKEIPAHVRVIGRVGRQLFMPEEKWVVDRMNKHRVLANDAQMKIYRRAFSREFVRVFGAHKFTSAIEFEGYSTFWTALLAAAPDPTRRVAFLHNDMRSEWLGRFPHLEAIFRVYPSFDALVSVSEVISEENRDHLGSLLALPDDRFVHAVNQINPANTLGLAKEDLDQDLLEWFSPAFKTLITLGRMSPEKDHEKLIRAFHQFRKTNTTARLVILGDGPLRQTLERLIADLELTDSVLLAGLRSNPFPALARADCFVLSSNHEGQPMVLLEALTLKKPIVSTDILGAKFVLQDGYGILVENSVAGLLKGLQQYVESPEPGRVFEYLEYQQKAHTQFVKSALPAESGIAATPTKARLAVSAS